MKVRLITDPDLPDDPSLFGPPDPPTQLWSCDCGHTWYSDLTESRCPWCNSGMIGEISEDEPEIGGEW